MYKITHSSQVSLLSLFVDAYTKVLSPSPVVTEGALADGGLGKPAKISTH
jgi:hypothetical protein